MRDFCKLAGAEFRADPEPATSRCYQSVIWCSTDKFLLMMSWTNGAAAAFAHTPCIVCPVAGPTPLLESASAGNTGAVFRDVSTRLLGLKYPDLTLSSASS